VNRELSVLLRFLLITDYGLIRLMKSEPKK